MELFTHNPIIAYQHLELWFTIQTHSSLHHAEPLWTVLSEYFSAAEIVDVFVPLVGAFHHQLLVRLVSCLSVINVITSLVKWCFPVNRPYWFAREFENLSNVSVLPQQQCETSAAFPSSHTMAFQAFISLFYISFFSHIWKGKSYFHRLMNMHVSVRNQMSFGVADFISLLMCFSRSYMGAQFLYHCLISAIAAKTLLLIFDRYSTLLGRLGKKMSVLIVLCCGLVAVLGYFAMLGMNIDPHWSVRMAFKWCSDASLLRHEASPIFVLARDFGYLMGVALSAPIYKSYVKKVSLTKRLPFLLFVVLLNYYARLETPKQHGRFVFLAYEFARNLIHSYTLLSVLPKIT